MPAQAARRCIPKGRASIICRGVPPLLAYVRYQGRLDNICSQ
jgi:hypothetical protein